MSPGASPRQGSTLDRVVRLSLINDLDCDRNSLARLLLDRWEESHLKMVEKWTVPETLASLCLDKREKMETEIQTLENVKDLARSPQDNKRCSEHILLTVLKRDQINAQILKGIVSKTFKEVEGLKGAVDKQFEEIERLKGVATEKDEHIEDLERRDREQIGVSNCQLESFESRNRELIVQIEKFKQSERDLVLKIQGLQNEGHELRSEIAHKNETIKALQFEIEESTGLIVEKSRVVENLEIIVVEHKSKVSELEALIESNRKRGEEDLLQLTGARRKLLEDQLLLEEDRDTLNKGKEKFEEDRFHFNEGAQRLGRNEARFEADLQHFARKMLSGMKTLSTTMDRGTLIYKQYLKDKDEPYQTLGGSTSMAVAVKNEELNLPVKMETDMDSKHYRHDSGYGVSSPGELGFLDLQNGIHENMRSRVS